MTSVFKFVVKSETLGLKEIFQGKCFGHAFSKAYGYATNDEKICKGLKYVFIKFVHVDLQKCIIWPNKFGTGQHEWNKVCIEVNLRLNNLNILMKIRTNCCVDI